MTGGLPPPPLTIVAVITTDYVLLTLARCHDRKYLLAILHGAHLAQ